MLWPERLLVDRQGAHVEWLGLVIAAMGLVQCSQVVEKYRGRRVSRSKLLLTQPQRLDCKGFRLRIPALRVERLVPVVGVVQGGRLGQGEAGPERE